MGSAAATSPGPAETPFFLRVVPGHALLPGYNIAFRRDDVGGGMMGLLNTLGKEVAGRYTGKVKFFRSINRLEPVADPYRIGLGTCGVPIPRIGPNK
jgi:hypothetical protein